MPVAPSSDVVPSPYPPILQSVMNHAWRLQEFFDAVEEQLEGRDSLEPWVIGRAGELQCFVAIVALDWHHKRTSDGEAAARLARYVRDMHDGIAMHLDVGLPPCCAGPNGPAASRGEPAEGRSPNARTVGI
jgi:hypothetical protein